jgi:hypothetical protein
MCLPTFWNNTQPAQHHWHDFELFPLSVQIHHTTQRFEISVILSSAEAENLRKS